MRKLPPTRTTFPSSKERLPLGQGLSVSPYCLGWVIDPRTVAAAIEFGINFFFLSTDLHAVWYRNTLEGLRRYLRGRPAKRQDLVISVVSYVEHTGFFEASLAELLQGAPELKYVDVAVVAGVGAHGHMARLETARRFAQEHASKRREPTPPAVGASFHNRRFALSAILWREVDIAFIRYNPAHPGARQQLFPFFERRGTAQGRSLVYNFDNSAGKLPDAAWARLGRGHGYWIPEHADYYRYALMRPELDGLLISPGTPQQLHSGIARAIEAGPLDAEQHSSLEEIALAQRRWAATGSPGAEGSPSPSDAGARPGPRGDRAAGGSPAPTRKGAVRRRRTGGPRRAR